MIGQAGRWCTCGTPLAPLVGLLGICLDLPHVTAKALSLLPVVCAKHPCAPTQQRRAVTLDERVASAEETS